MGEPGDASILSRRVEEGQVHVWDWDLGSEVPQAGKLPHVGKSHWKVCACCSRVGALGSDSCPLLLKLFRTVLEKIVPREQQYLRKPSHTYELSCGCDLTSQKESLVQLS